MDDVQEREAPSFRQKMIRGEGGGEFGLADKQLNADHEKGGIEFDNNRISDRKLWQRQTI